MIALFAKVSLFAEAMAPMITLLETPTYPYSEYFESCSSLGTSDFWQHTEKQIPTF